jgi:AAA15 family ATPase/GTPase
MIVQFLVENYKSFKNETIFSFVGSATTKELEDTNIFYQNNYKLLKSNAVFGANASGKSNLLNALKDMKRIVLSSFQNALIENYKEKSIQPYKLSTETKDLPSTFETVFIINNKQYRFGFEIKDSFITSEWLFHIPSKIETYLFTREGTKIKINKTQFTEGVGLEGKTRDNVLFLSVCSQFNGSISNGIIDWFKSLGFVSGIDDDRYSGYTTNRIKNDEKFKNWINKFISFLEISKLSVEDELLEQLNIDELEIPDEKKELKLALEALRNLQEKQKTVPKLKSWHNVYNNNNIIQETIPFDFHSEESKGTQKLVYILGPIYDTLVNGKILLIDEFDSRLHTLLCKYLINLFNSLNKRNAQFAFIIHDTNVLNSEFFRRDQLWFTEKDQFGSTSIYSLNDYGKVRNDAKFEKNYLKGDYGAIPYLDDINNQIESLYGGEQKI